MSYLAKSLGVAVTALACWVAACGTAAERPDAPAPPSRATPGETQPDREEPARPADAAPAGRVEEPPPRTDLPAPGQPAAPRSRNTLRGSANGIGNTIIIENGTGRSRTVLENVRNGLGNRVVIVDGEVVTDRPAPERPGGNGPKFGSVRFFSPMHGCMLYWNPRTLTWCRYDADREDYVPAEWDY